MFSTVFIETNEIKTNEFKHPDIIMKEKEEKKKKELRSGIRMSRPLGLKRSNSTISNNSGHSARSLVSFNSMASSLLTGMSKINKLGPSANTICEAVISEETGAESFIDEIYKPKKESLIDKKHR